MQNNNLARPNLFSSLSKPVKDSSKIIKDKLLNLNLDLDFFVNNKEKINLDLLDKINELKQFEQENDQLLINNDENLKIIIAKNIFNKLKNLNNKMKKKYNAFTLDVRTSSLDPILFIKKHADIIKIIYPIVITNPETDLQSWTYEEFDYGLLDESSQIYLEKGIPILYLTKIKIMAGDDQQMQPSRWFATKSDNEENPFGNIESLLDFAVAKGTYAILLDKNYRSNYASLMTFNSQIFYKGQLDVVDANSLNKDVSIEVINTDGIWENSKNEKELELMIEQAQKNLNKYKKIILLCFNSSQQMALENLIFNSHSDLELAIDKQKILIRNIENIQGDEADLLIASVAYDKNTKFHSTYVAKPGGKNALNVATSRAKDKMIIIKSIYSDEIINNNNSIDIKIFKEWLKFLDLSEEEKKNYKIEKDFVAKSDELSVDEEKNEYILNLIEIIKDDLLNEINDFEMKIDVVANYSIGTIKIPLALIDKKTGDFIVGVYLDVFSYYKSYIDFINDKDIENFFKAKKYNVLRIGFLDWEIKKNVLIKAIDDYIFKNY